MIGQDPQFTVSEFVAVFNQSMDVMYPMVAIVGEVANLRISKGRWVYFDLKDDQSSVKFFGTVQRLPGPLENGMTCEVWGRPRLHNLYGFSVNFEQIRPVGEGAIKKAQELLLAKLEKEGLFAPERKRPIPYPPESIGLITSSESAAISDFRKIITARWPVLRIEFADVQVQGAQAVQPIIDAIQTFNQLSSPPDVLVIIRGGGSTDDLAVFSDEQVVRAVAGSRIPTVVAIGHERDVSLAELVADVRASTPSNAAEILVPDAHQEKQLLLQYRHAMNTALSNAFNLEANWLKDIKQRLFESLQTVVTNERRSLVTNSELLEAFDPRLPLKRGYALVWNGKGKPVRSIANLNDNEVFSIEFTDGKKHITVNPGE
jgi:exodeoxyribonuclease VII large subunit